MYNSMRHAALAVSLLAPVGLAFAQTPANIVGPGEGTALQVLGESITVKVSGQQTDGGYAVIEEVSPANGGPPPHIHSHEDETFYVLEGEVEFRVGDETFTAQAGSTAFLPRNVLHTFRNVGDTPSKVMVVVSPAKFVGFFEEIDALKEQTPENALPIAEKYGLTIPPPPGTN